MLRTTLVSLLLLSSVVAAAPGPGTCGTVSQVHLAKSEPLKLPQVALSINGAWPKDEFRVQMTTSDLATRAPSLLDKMVCVQSSAQRTIRDKTVAPKERRMMPTYSPAPSKICIYDATKTPACTLISS